MKTDKTLVRIVFAIWGLVVVLLIAAAVAANRIEVTPSTYTRNK